MLLHLFLHGHKYAQLVRLVVELLNNFRATEFFSRRPLYRGQFEITCLTRGEESLPAPSLQHLKSITHTSYHLTVYGI
jgi:hypothetical protein